MSMLPETKYNYAIKKIVGKGHSQNKDFPSEADTSFIPTLADNVWVDAIPTDSTTAVIAGIAERVEATLELDVTSNGKSYKLKYPATHPTKPNQYMEDIIPDFCGVLYEPIFWRNKGTATRIYVADSADWFLDPANGRITSEENLSLDANARCDVFVYIGKKLSTAGSVGKSVQVDEFTYSGQASLTLTYDPSSIPTLTVYGGIPQDPGVDYGISGDQILLNTYPVASVLENGDIIQVVYSYAG
jgi:hypothetical protein